MNLEAIAIRFGKGVGFTVFFEVLAECIQRHCEQSQVSSETHLRFKMVVKSSISFMKLSVSS